jgi:2-polyprenyl-6-methoxyphenol hydroxylase-like FAD-dependent oxidoreductase
MEHLGLVPILSDHATAVFRLVLVDDVGRPIASMPTRRSRDRELEIPRSALTMVLVDEARNDAEFRFGDSIRKLEIGERGVDVTFHHAASERFDLIVGADGLHSTVRRLAFGPESDYLTHLGLYVATVGLIGPADRADTIVMHNQPGAATALHPSTGSPIAILIFRSPTRIDPRDAEAASRLLTQTYQGAGWRSREILTTYCQAPDSYFDAVSRIRVPRWSRGRITLLGDAASCVSLFGEGSSAAIVGASTLARSLGTHAQDIPVALARYEATHRPVTARGQSLAPMASHILVPASATGIKLRNRLLQLAQPTIKSQNSR